MKMRPWKSRSRNSKPRKPNSGSNCSGTSWPRKKRILNASAMTSPGKRRPWRLRPPPRHPLRLPRPVFLRSAGLSPYLLPMPLPPPPAATIKCSTKALPPTASGWKPRNTVTSGNPPARRPVGGPTPSAAGRTRIRAGPGFPTNPMAGPPITTAAGLSWNARVGSGFLAIPGLRPGFPGGTTPIWLAGPLCLRKRSMRTT